MHNLAETLNKLLDRWEHWLQQLSETWEFHTNRRTVLTLVMGGVIVIFLYISFVEPPDTFPTGVLVNVPDGATLSAVAHDFEKTGVVRSALALEVVVRAIGRDRGVHAGDYLFNQPKDLFSIARALSLGAFGLEPTRIRVPEGATVAGMARIFAPVLQRFDKDQFVRNATPYEGQLFPDTYFFMPNATDQTVLDTLRSSFDQHMTDLETKYGTSTRPGGQVRSREDIVKMASILEREAQTYDDRRMIAGILWKRLDKGMLLQVDAVFLYTLGRSTFDLTTRDLASDSPYNTYKYKGLPPTAIGSPSLSSLEAAMNPAKSDYWFYLADQDHVTHYSKTYEEHLAKKKLYIGT